MLNDEGATAFVSWPLMTFTVMAALIVDATRTNTAGNFSRQFDSACERHSKLFTGLVEETGTIRAISRQAPGARIAIATRKICTDASLGDSIAVNGCCLTIVEMAANVLTFEAVQETLDRTNLGQKQIGELVNLERSLSVGDRLGGHFVTGHIDGQGTLSRTEPGDLWSKYWFQVASPLTRQMASKGSVTVDGVSLTLVDVRNHDFSVALIPHTLKFTTLGRLKVGDSVNVETDVLAKYVQRQISGDSPIDDQSVLATPMKQYSDRES